MRIEFERSGGLAGMRLTLSVDTDTLPESEADEIAKLVKEADFFALPEEAGTPPGADAFNYKVTIESEGRSHTVRTSELEAPPGLSPLLQRLERLARRKRGD